MPNERTHIAVIGPSDKFKVCIDYLFQVFCKTYGYTYNFVEPGAAAPQSDILLVYGNESEVTSNGHVIRIPDSGFFGSGFGRSANAPAGFSELVAVANQSGFSNVCQRE